MPARFEIGQGVIWYSGNDRFYGLVTASSDTGMELAPLVEADASTRCFDEGGSKYDTDRYKVRPRGCPPPFTLSYGTDFGIYGAYINADPSARLFADAEIAEACGMYVSDDGELAPDEVVKNTLAPVWWDEKERAKIPWVDPTGQPGPQAPRKLSATDRLRMALELSASVETNERDDRQYGG